MDLLNSRSFRVVQSRIRRVWGGFSERRRFGLGKHRRTPRRKQPRGRFLHARRPRNRARFRWIGQGRRPPTRGARASARAEAAGSRRPASAARAKRPMLAHGRSRSGEAPRARAWASRAGRPSLGWPRRVGTDLCHSSSRDPTGVGDCPARKGPDDYGEWGNWKKDHSGARPGRSPTAPTKSPFPGHGPVSRRLS